MMSMKKVWNRRNAPWLLSLIVVVSLVAAGTQVACTTNQSGGTQPSGNTNDNSGSTVGGAILNIQADVTLSGGQAITILYSTPTNATDVRAFYVPVEGSGSTAVETGDEVIIASGLAAGSSKSFEFQTQELATGKYKVGIRYGETARALCTGVITITGLPAPTFISPSQSVSVVRGAQVDVRVDLGSAENAVNWRLFYMDFGNSLTGLNPDQYGMELETGTQNVVIFYWNTAGAEPGQYTLGISSTDSGKTVAQAVAAGEEDTIVTTLSDIVVTVLAEEPESTNPTITLTSPETNVSVFGEKQIPITFTAQAYEGNSSDWKVSLYYDTNAQYSGTDGTEVAIETDIPINATNATFDTSDVADGTYYIVGIAEDGVNNPAVDYANGQVIISRTANLEVTDPSTGFNRDIGEEVTIAWQTNVPDDEGSITVNVYRVDADGNRQGTPEVLLTDASTTTYEATYTTSSPGRFQAEVVLTFTDTTLGTISANAPAYIRVTTLPTILWVGSLSQDLDKDDRPFKGYTFEGHQFEDNLGSSFLGGEDFNQDGVDDFLIVARYAKPEFINPQGIGEGEVYLVRGNESRDYGNTNINAIGTESLPGITLTPPTPALPVDDQIVQTFGVTSLALYPDSDLDGVDELIIGFPRIDSSEDDITGIQQPGMFTSGGAVVISSKNSYIRGQEFFVSQLDGDEYTSGKQLDETDGRLSLDWVGQMFQVQEALQEGGFSIESNWEAHAARWTRDRYAAHTDADCPEDPLAVGIASYYGCTSGTDEIDDTLVYPSWGFPVHMAIPWIEMHENNWKSYFPRFNPWRNAYADPSVDALACPAYDEDGDFDACNTAANPGGCFSSIDEMCMTIWLDLEGSENPEDPQPVTECGGIECETQKLAFKNALTETLVLANSAHGSAFFILRFTGTVWDTWTNAMIPHWNHPLEPYGCRIVGRPADPLESEDPVIPGDHADEGRFGWNISVCGREIIVMAPNRTACSGGYQPDAFGIPAKEDDEPDAGTNGLAGVGYVFSAMDLWTLGLLDRQYAGAYETNETRSIPTIFIQNDPEEPLYDISQYYQDVRWDNRIPPGPHMYQAGGYGHGGFDTHIVEGAGFRWSDLLLDRGYTADNTPQVEQGGIAIVGQENETIRNVLGIKDFNADSRDDILIGSPLANGGSPASGVYNEDTYGDGAIYIVFRRPRSLEGDYILEKLAYSTSNPERLSGILVNGPAGARDGFGESIGTGFDMNDDDRDDVMVGNFNGNGGQGEVYVIFSSDQITTPQNGASITTLVANHQACRILGNQANGQFGFNVTGIGDINGDGHDDLAISAPMATPLFDSNPFDSTDQLDTPGLDINLDGEKDDVTGPNGVADGEVDEWDSLTNAGLVYVVYGGQKATDWASDSSDPYEISIGKLGTKDLPGFILVGNFQLDQLGGGYAGDPDPANNSDGFVGGIAYKSSLSPGDLSSGNVGVGDSTNGRSKGLAPVGDVNGDGYADFMIGSILADPRKDPSSGVGVTNAGEAYLIYGFKQD